jgi:uncharacterized membrane protein YciS (DUF1049 family)
MKGLRRLSFVVVFVALLYAGWRFAAGNETIVTVDYVLGRVVDVALWKALLIAAGAGMAGTFVLMVFSLIRARLEARRFRKALVKMEKELNGLRPTPMIDDAVAEQHEISAAEPGGRGVVQNA